MRKPFSSSIHNGKFRGARSAEADALDADARDALAGEALTYLASDPERLDRFFAVTGLSAETLRGAAGTPAFLGHLVDYLAEDERRLVAFCAETGRDPAAVEAVRQSLAAPIRDD